MRSYTYCTSFSDILYLWFSSFKFSNVFLPAETVILGCSWVAFWPVMTCKMMYQIGYSFYWSIKRWSKLGPKYFWLILRVFLFMPSCTLWVISPKVLPNERAGEISVASSISIEFLVMKLKIFTVFCIDSTCNEWNGPFLVLLGPCSPRYCSILLKFWPEVFSNKTNWVFEKPFKI